MSAYIVEDRTINVIVSWINKVGMAGWSNDQFYCVQPLIKLGYILDTDLGCKRLAEEIFTLNCDSVEQRYGEGQAEEFRPLNFRYEYHIAGTRNLYQVLKSLRCLLYQCCEGNIPQQNNLYQALDAVSLAISYHIISHSDRYAAAKWE